MRKILFASIMIKRTDVHFVASRAVAFDSFVLFWVIQALNCGVALIALDATLTIVPAHAILKCFTVFGGIPEQVVGSAEIAGVMCVNAAF